MTSGHLFMLAAESADKKPTDHVIDNAVLVVDGWWVWTGHMGMLVVSGIVTALVMWYASTKIATGPDRDGNERFLTRNPFASLIEVICLYLREQVVRPILHDRTDRFIPFLWTIFFFILINNLLGLIPLLDIYHLFGGHTVLLRRYRDGQHLGHRRPRPRRLRRDQHRRHPRTRVRRVLPPPARRRARSTWPRSWSPSRSSAPSSSPPR
jgi:hypothetical protein